MYSAGLERRNAHEAVNSWQHVRLRRQQYNGYLAIPGAEDNIRQNRLFYLYAPAHGRVSESACRA